MHLVILLFTVQFLFLQDGRKGELHDFGIDICSVPDMELPQFDVEIDANNFIDNEMEIIPGLRYYLLRI